MSSFSIAVWSDTLVTALCITFLYFLIKINPFCSSEMTPLFRSLSVLLCFYHTALVKHASSYLSSLSYICSKTHLWLISSTSLSYVQLVLRGDTVVSWSFCLPFNNLFSYLWLLGLDFPLLKYMNTSKIVWFLKENNTNACCSFLFAEWMAFVAAQQHIKNCRLC